ncbi:MarR family winged helix-turn-helix transcriptional regulator [Asticcacaulis sp.]|uniref:MarR family winged helix-turn-helix transcriptional regulator n=1 Tax=Asticcacaulis sp. TaxID=1872648 RepID=UPI002B84BA60|nr:MarR family winged helix-turn-helix transcriptional regulator [Asticcacaulis sp.]HTM82494.1 MarR family winged helix-turn-helix transcriptional regulator [Asticcacaulis sp.]
MQNTHISEQIRALHGSMIDIVSFMNHSQVDEVLIRKAGIRLDRALFPLLVGIERFGPIGIVDLAERAGRDYTTVSRQVGKLEAQGLVERRAQPADKRVREAMITPKGKVMTDAVDAAREQIGRQILENWEPAEVETLIRLMRKLTGALQETSQDASQAREKTA